MTSLPASYAPTESQRAQEALSNALPMRKLSDRLEFVSDRFAQISDPTLGMTTTAGPHAAAMGVKQELRNQHQAREEQIN